MFDALATVAAVFSPIAVLLAVILVELPLTCVCKLPPSEAKLPAASVVISPLTVPCKPFEVIPGTVRLLLVRPIVTWLLAVVDAFAPKAVEPVKPATAPSPKAVEPVAVA